MGETSWYQGPVRTKSKAYVPPPDDGEILLGLYARISSADDDLGVRRQLEELQDPNRGLLATNYMLRARRVRIVKIYVDNNISAHDITKVREEFAQMQQDMANGVINSVGAWAADRIFRQPHEFETFHSLMDMCGGMLIVTLENENVNVRTSEGLMVFRVKINVADEEIRKGKRRIRAQKTQLRKSASFSYQGGPRRFGYNQQMTEIIESEAEIIRYCAKELLSGRKGYDLCKELNSRGILTAKRAQWRQTNLQRVIGAFRNAGLFIDVDGQAKPAQWSAILDRDTFTRLQVLLADPDRRIHEGTKATEPLSGLLLCGACGKSNLRVQRVTSSGTFKWQCQSDGGCGKLSRNDELLSPWIIGEILAAYRNPDFVNGLIALDAAAPEEENLFGELRAAEALIKELKDSFWTPAIPELRPSQDDFVKYMKIHEGRMAVLREKIRTATKRQDLDKGLLDLILDGRLDETWVHRQLHEKQAVLKFAVRKVLVKPVGKGRRNLPPEDHYEIQWRDANHRTTQ